MSRGTAVGRYLLLDRVGAGKLKHKLFEDTPPTRAARSVNIDAWLAAH